MSVRILSQADMNIARRVVSGTGYSTGDAASDGFCYICGRRLPPRAERSKRRALTSTEHVIPKALLGRLPTNPRNQWAITLPVHRSCEAKKKRERDEALKAVHAILKFPRDEWAMQDVTAMKRFMRPPVKSESGEAMAVLGDVKFLLDGIWTWLRGIHAVLYGQYLSSQTHFQVMSPLPGYQQKSRTPLHKQSQDEQLRSNTILRSLVAASRIDSWDGFSLRDNQVQYMCLWHLPHAKDIRQCGRAMCFWALDFPGVYELSASMQRPVPWRGTYSIYVEKPACAAILTDEIIEEANRIKGPVQLM
jgi:hypothetical protein